MISRIYFMLSVDWISDKNLFKFLSLGIIKIHIQGNMIFKTIKY